ncbi:MAG: glycosyltransferase family 2 protein [Lentisphaerae bacterium]|nr:glycosyltransferase family 2 protein [Lentisphaerota bacterium]
MKVIIQIPCFNEAETLPATVGDLPRQIPGVDTLEYLVIDDGSEDGTADVARQLGVHHILRLGSNRGLARAFAEGIERALALGADIVVNTDADNQYRAADIPKLLGPILVNQADVVVGCRPILEHPEFSSFKKMLQLLGSWTLRQISKTTVRDAASGFRAFSRESCQRLFIYSSFSYCMESLIQAGNMGLRVASVDIGVNPQTRPSRLFKSIPAYVRKQAGTMLAMFVLYRPGRFFSSLGGLLLAASVILGVRFLYLVYWLPREPGRTYLPSLILLSLLALAGFLCFLLGIIGELMKFQRRIAEENLFLIRRAEDAGRRVARP